MKMKTPHRELPLGFNVTLGVRVPKTYTYPDFDRACTYIYAKHGVRNVLVGVTRWAILSGVLPSAEDLDAMAEEDRIRLATA